MSSWQDDPEIAEQIRIRNVRMGILRSAIIWTPFFVLSLGAFLFFLFDQVTGGDRGSWFLLVVLAIFSLLFGTQSVQSLVDLFGKPRTMEGEVTRRWARNDSFVLRTHYVRIDKTILRGDRFLLDPIQAGDRVTATFYPHSAVLISIEKLPEPKEPGEDEPAPDYRISR